MIIKIVKHTSDLYRNIDNFLSVIFTYIFLLINIQKYPNYYNNSESNIW